MPGRVEELAGKPVVGQRVGGPREARKISIFLSEKFMRNCKCQTIFKQFAEFLLKYGQKLYDN